MIVGKNFRIEFLVNFQEGVVCQHGPQECELNRISSCAIHLNPDQQVWFPFAKCLESSGPSRIHPLEPAEPCAQDASISYSAIQDCASGKLKTCQECICLSCSASHLLTACCMPRHIAMQFLHAILLAKLAPM